MMMMTMSLSGYASAVEALTGGGRELNIGVQPVAARTSSTRTADRVTA